jgi:hypothetical protein
MLVSLQLGLVLFLCYLVSVFYLKGEGCCEMGSTGMCGIGDGDGRRGVGVGSGCNGLGIVRNWLVIAFVSGCCWSDCEF